MLWTVKWSKSWNSQLLTYSIPNKLVHKMCWNHRVGHKLTDTLFFPQVTGHETRVPSPCMPGLIKVASNIRMQVFAQLQSIWITGITQNTPQPLQNQYRLEIRLNLSSSSIHQPRDIVSKIRWGCDFLLAAKRPRLDGSPGKPSHRLWTEYSCRLDSIYDVYIYMCVCMSDFDVLCWYFRTYVHIHLHWYMNPSIVYSIFLI